MLTVIREMATAAQAVPDSLGLEHLLAAVEEAGRIAVENTTAQLPALQKAGVVDAGGYGLLVLFRGLADGHRGPHARRQGRRRRPPRGARRRRGRSSARVRPGRAHAVTVEEPSELSEFRYCTSFLITGEAIDREAFEAFLLPLGDSALVVGDERTVKVHVHVNDPGVVLSEALKHGSIGDVEINDMHAQTRERDERLATRGRARGRRGRHRGRRRRRRRRQPAALPRPRLPRHRRRRPVHEPERRPAARGGRGARRRRGRHPARTTATSSSPPSRRPA